MHRKEKSFSNFRANGLHLNFPNGNQVSTIWGAGTYSDNYNYQEELAVKEGLSFKDSSQRSYSDLLDANLVETMINCSDALLRRLEKKHNDGNEQPFNRIDIAAWLDIVNKVAAEKTKKN